MMSFFVGLDFTVLKKEKAESIT